MTIKFNYTIYPDDISTLPKSHLDEGKSDTVTILAFSGVAIMVIGGIWALVNLFTGGYGWLICLVLWIINISILRIIQNIANNDYKEGKVKSQAEYLSDKLNDILMKSEDIVSNIIGYYETSAKQYLDIAKTDFSDNVISAFWDNIEEASKNLALYKEAIDQLSLNGEIYSAILRDKKHNFPSSFPVGTNISVPRNILDEFTATIRIAQSKFEFAYIWEQRKTQKILIAGFQNLGQAINKMKEEIVSSIESLECSLKSEFRELKNIKLEQLRTFEENQKILNNTLSSMDNKLYYIQYKEKPVNPFFPTFKN